MLKQLYIIGAAALALTTSVHAAAVKNVVSFTTEADNVTNVPSVVEMLSTEAPLDGPKVIPVNSTTFDWWYFDAVSEDASQSLTINFYSAPYSALGFGAELDTLNFVHISGNFPNKTMFVAAVPAQDSYVSTVGNGSSGYWTGSGLSWSGSPNLREYIVQAEDLGSGFSGTVKLRSVAPAHYPCGPVSEGQTEVVVPGVGWANSLPDAEAEVEFKIGDHKMSFTGSGYHDKNWGSRKFTESVGNWYWGHGRLGDYSIVWFDTLDTKASEYVSAYVAKDGKILTHQCSGLKVRPTGDNATYPPIASTGSPSGFHLEMDLGDEGILLADMTNLVLATEIGNQYERFIGNITGTLGGVSLTPGYGLWEQFKLMESWK